ncbi:MAG: hypothetical protein D4S01_09140 [Dehalococcoidia bacterium]|nr:MAG: hypothetical protein D4S01_09140 [Dehalococcoidia bacterium]
MLPRLDIFHSYNYYNTAAAQRDLTKTEQAFYDFCKDHHNEICDEDTPEEILKKASALWMVIA